MKKVKAISFGGILSGLSLVILCMTALFPFAEYTCPALAGILLCSLVIEFNQKTALSAYIAVSLLALFILPSKEVAVLFAGFFGYYPIIKSNLEKVKNRVIEWILKLLVFNGAIVGAYSVIIYLFGMTALLEDLGGGYEYGVLFMLAIGNLVFILYDIVTSRVAYFYLTVISPRLKLH